MHAKDSIISSTEIDGQQYNLQVSFSKRIDDTDPELFSFFAIFFKTMMRKLTFE